MLCLFDGITHMLAQLLPAHCKIWTPVARCFVCSWRFFSQALHFSVILSRQHSLSPRALLLFEKWNCSHLRKFSFPHLHSIGLHYSSMEIEEKMHNILCFACTRVHLLAGSSPTFPHYYQFDFRAYNLHSATTISFASCYCNLHSKLILLCSQMNDAFVIFFFCISHNTNQSANGVLNGI